LSELNSFIVQIRRKRSLRAGVIDNIFVEKTFIAVASTWGFSLILDVLEMNHEKQHKTQKRLFSSLSEGFGVG
jgi:hypothetical protein